MDIEYEEEGCPPTLILKAEGVTDREKLAALAQGFRERADASIHCTEALSPTVTLRIPLREDRECGDP